MTPTNRVIIAGSRTLEDYELVCKTLGDVFATLPKDDTVILSGTARGADKLGEQWAAEHGYPVVLFPADWTAHGQRAGIIRNEQMAENATHLVAFWDGISKGTRHMIAAASGRGIEIWVIRFEVQP